MQSPRSNLAQGAQQENTEMKNTRNTKPVELDSPACRAVFELVRNNHITSLTAPLYRRPLATLTKAGLIEQTPAGSFVVAAQPQAAKPAKQPAKPPAEQPEKSSAASGVARPADSARPQRAPCAGLSRAPSRHASGATRCLGANDQHRPFPSCSSYKSHQAGEK